MAYPLNEIGFVRDESKSELLKKTRGISFEDIVLRIAGEDLLDVIEHPAPERYTGQKVFVLKVDDYVVLVPFVEDEWTVVPKTIIPSRKMTRRYLGAKRHEP